MHKPSLSSSLPHPSQRRQDSYREVKPLPVSLLDHCTTDLEEGLFSQGFSLLSNALVSGTGSSVPAQIPLTQHLAFAATLIVHPQLTSRTNAPDKHIAADDALIYLRQVNKLAGPRNAGLDKALRFRHEAVSTRSKWANIRFSDITNVDRDADVGQIRSTYADGGSIWAKAGDFWSLVGWAFNCSVAHFHRWERWKLLLDLILDVLEDDLEDRLDEAQDVYSPGGAAAVDAVLKESLFTQYLLPVGEGRNNKRRVMRAILADGTRTSLAEFGEVWRHETKLPKQDEDLLPNKKRKLDIENDEFGDYFDQSDQESPVGPTPRSRSTASLPNLGKEGAVSEADVESGDESNGAKTPNGSFTTPDVESFGGMDALRLRQRILALLTHYCSVNPNEFLDHEDLFDLYTEFLRPLPLSIFQQFVLPTKPYLEPNDQAALSQMLLRPLLAATAPVYNENALTQEDFEAYYAPHAANNTSATANAKVSLLMESLLRLLWRFGSLQATKQLRDLVAQGVTARKEKVAFYGRRKVGAKAKVDEEAVDALDHSGERMLITLDMAA